MLKVIGWIDYDNFNFATAEGTEEEIAAVAKNIYENGYKFGGDDHENMSNCCPLLSNGKALRKSWRGWGYVMAVAYNLKTEDGLYNHILWYMGEYGPEKRVFPKAEPIDFSLCPQGKTFVYQLSDDEYHAINNVAFNRLVLPVDFYQTVELKTFDVVVFKHHEKVLLEGMVNELSFMFCTVEELFEQDGCLCCLPSENTNFRDFDATKLQKFLQEKYNVDNDRLVCICFDTTNDQRLDAELYA